MTWLPVSRRRHLAEIADARTEADRLRTERDAALEDLEACKTAAATSARLYVEADATITRLTGRNEALGDRLLEAQVASGFNPVEARRTAERIATLQKAAAAGREEAVIARAEARRERKRADQLQKKYDEAVGLGSARPQDSARWQPGYEAPTPDKSVTS
jgi:chromosome segregation ATPase